MVILVLGALRFFAQPHVPCFCSCIFFETSEPPRNFHIVGELGHGDQAARAVFLRGYKAHKHHNKSQRGQKRYFFAAAARRHWSIRKRQNERRMHCFATAIYTLQPAPKTPRRLTFASAPAARRRRRRRCYGGDKQAKKRGCSLMILPLNHC